MRLHQIQTPPTGVATASRVEPASGTCFSDVLSSFRHQHREKKPTGKVPTLSDYQEAAAAAGEAYRPGELVSLEA